MLNEDSTPDIAAKRGSSTNMNNDVVIRTEMLSNAVVNS